MGRCVRRSRGCEHLLNRHVALLVEQAARISHNLALQPEALGDRQGVGLARDTPQHIVCGRHTRNVKLDACVLKGAGAIRVPARARMHAHTRGVSSQEVAHMRMQGGRLRGRSGVCLRT